MKLICVPNGVLSNLFDCDLIENFKTYEYANKNNNGKVIKDEKPLDYNFPNDAIKIKCKTKDGYYIKSKNEIWLTVKRNNKLVYGRVTGSHSVRIDFNTLKQRFDSSKKPWKGFAEFTLV